MEIKTGTKWVVTATEHDDCDKCKACIPNAEAMAAVTGSVGSTYTDDGSRIGGLVHSATVARKATR